MLDTFFGPHCFEAKWWWMRFELQQRGAFHIHGCVRLKGAPEMTDLGKMVHEGRMAQQLLQDNNIPLQPDESFSASQTSLDKWVQADEDFPILNEENEQDYGEIDSLKQTIKQGLTAEKQIVLMHEMLLKTHHGSPLIDATEQSRDPSTDFDPEGEAPTDFDPEGEAPHPSSLDPAVPNINRFNCDLLNAVQRHNHSNSYCLKCKKTMRKKQNYTHRHNASPAPEEMNNNCRFGYCKPLRDNYCVAIIQKECKKKGSDGEKQYVTHIELFTPRDDGWINSYMPALMGQWRANMDVRLTIDLGKIVQYMAKYVTKAESTITKGGEALMRRVIKDNLNIGSSVDTVLRKAMNKLMGEPMLQKQETCHQIAGNPTARCSHTFVAVNVLKDAPVRVLPAEENYLNNGEQRDDEQQGMERTTQMSIVDAYGRRHTGALWQNNHEYIAIQDKLDNMSLDTFAKKFTVGQRQQYRNKIKFSTNNNNKVIKFTPRIRGTVDSPMYHEYCKVQLARYKPWSGSQNTLWGGINNPTEDVLIQEWQEYIMDLNVRGKLPDSLLRALKNQANCCRRRS
jgi:hypothetical protein